MLACEDLKLEWQRRYTQWTMADGAKEHDPLSILASESLIERAQALRHHARRVVAESRRVRTATREMLKGNSLKERSDIDPPPAAPPGPHAVS